MQLGVRLLMVVAAVAGGLSAASVVTAASVGASTIPTLTGVVDGQAISGSGLYGESDLTGGGNITFNAIDGVIHVKRLVAAADDCAGPAAVCELFSISGIPSNIVITPVEFLKFASRPPLIIPQIAFVKPGTSGMTPLPIPILLSYRSTQIVTVQWRTVAIPGAGPSQATPGLDYTAASGTLTFPPGSQQENAVVSVNGRVAIPPVDYFVVQTGNPTNATMGGFWGLGFGAILS